jgi:hypothetical protein
MSRQYSQARSPPLWCDPHHQLRTRYEIISVISLNQKKTNTMTTISHTPTITSLIVSIAEQQIADARREEERQEHIAALAAMEKHQISDDEGWQWRTDELTTLLSEDLKQAIENSGCPREVVFSALMGLFSPYAGLEICTVHDESYAALEEILSKEQWAEHSDDAEVAETTDE